MPCFAHLSPLLTFMNKTVHALYILSACYMLHTRSLLNTKSRHKPPAYELFCILHLIPITKYQILS